MELDILINGLRQKYVDCKTLFDFAFDNYTTHYKELQEKKQKELKLTTVEVSETSEPQNDIINYDFFRGLSKIIAVIAIIITLRLLFKKRKPKKKKNRYKFGGKKKKPKH